MIFAPQILPIDVQAVLINPSTTILHIQSCRAVMSSRCYETGLDWIQHPKCRWFNPFASIFVFSTFNKYLCCSDFFFLKVLNMSLKHRPVSLQMNIPKPCQHGESHPLPEEPGAVYTAWRAAGLLTQLSFSSPAATECKSLTRACF